MEVKEGTITIKADLDRGHYIKALKDLLAKIKKVNDYNAQMSLINKKLGVDLNTAKELEAYLEKSTGFKNLEMAADALNVKEDFKRALELTIPEIEAALIITGKNGQIEESPEAKDILKDRYTSNVDPQFVNTAQKFLDFKKWYDTLSNQEKLAFEQFRRTELKVKLDSLTYVHR